MQGAQGKKSTPGFSFSLTGLPPCHVELGWVAAVRDKGGTLVAVQGLLFKGEMQGLGWGGRHCSKDLETILE